MHPDEQELLRIATVLALSAGVMARWISDGCTETEALSLDNIGQAIDEGRQAVVDFIAWAEVKHGQQMLFEETP